MKFIIVAAVALVAFAAAFPVNDAEKKTEIVDYKSEMEPNGEFSFTFQLSDGTERQEKGTLKEALDEDNKPHKVIEFRGSYSYLDPEGKPVTITYFADETGFHPEGESIPVATRR